LRQSQWQPAILERGLPWRNFQIRAQVRLAARRCGFISILLFGAEQVADHSNVCGIRDREMTNSHRIGKSGTRLRALSG